MRNLSTVGPDLLLALHDGSFEQPMWSRFLDLLRSETGAAHAGLAVGLADKEAIIRLHSGRPSPPALSRMLSKGLRAAYGVRGAEREGRVYALDELIANEGSAARKEIHEDLRQAGDLRFARCVRVTEPAGTSAWLVLAGERELPANVSSLLSRLAPHLRSALRSFASLETERMRSMISSEAMDRLSFGWLSVDSHLRVVDTSPNIHLILRRTKLIGRSRYDVLSFASPVIDREVRAAIKTYANKQSSRPRLFNIHQDPWIDIFVMPALRKPASLGKSVSAIIYVSGDRWSRDDRCDQLVDLFGLMPSEARLAWAMAQGRSIAEAAEDLGLTIETARNYSKKIYAKLGLRGQAELVRLILTSVLSII